jgi:DNA-binding transcriptional LysR family regulator
MDTRDIDYLLAVDMYGGVSRAAEALGLSQPALTKAIQRVEAMTGLPLFERTALGVTPTQAGALFINRAKRIRLEYEDAMKEMHGLKSGEQGILRIGYSPSMPTGVIVGACRQLIKERPVARLRMSRRFARELLDMVTQGTLDLAIVPLPEVHNEGFRVWALFSDRLAVMADDGHPLLRRQNLTLNDLVDQEWLLPGSQFTLRQRVETAFRQQGLPQPHLRIEVDFGGALLFDLIRGTQMLSVAGAESSGVVPGFRPLDVRQDELDLRRKVGIVARAGAYLPPLAERLTTLLEDQVT